MAPTAVALVLSSAPRDPRQTDAGFTEALHADRDPQFLLSLASDGVQSQVWESRYGPMLIEVKDGQVFVNGQRVERAAP